MTSYYVRSPGSSHFHGPCTLEQLRADIAAGRIGSDASVLEATGQTSSQLRQSTDWMPISALDLVLPAGSAPGRRMPPPKRALINRYRDAYRVGDAAVGFGTLLKAFGWLLGIITILGGIFLESQITGDGSPFVIIYALFVGIAQIVIFMFFGILVSAIGQILRSSLDTAVHTSPLLDDEQRTEAMSV